MPSEIDLVLSDFRRGKSAQYATYNQKAHNNVQDSFTGYVADVTANNRLTNSYNVMVPGLNSSMLRNIPRKVPDGFSQSNGVGRSSVPLRTGQPVIIRFLSGRSSLPYIDGSINLNGTDPNWLEAGVPGIDQKDPESSLTIWRTPALPETVAAGGDAETTVYPLIPRSQAPGQGQNTATGLEIPGNTRVVDYAGNVFNTTIGQTINIGPNAITEVSGTRGSLADEPIVNAIREASRVQAVIVEELTYWRSMIGGTYTLVSPHPSNNPDILNGSLTADLGNLDRFLHGNLTIPTGLTIPALPGSAQVEGILSKVDSTMGFIAEASKASGIQLDFLQKKIGPIIALAKKLWGSYEKFGNINLSLDIPLPFNLQISLSVSFDFKTGKLSITGSVGSGSRSGTLIPKQALPLRSEGGFTTGGLPRLKNPTYTVKEEVVEITTTTIYTRYPNLIPPNRPPYLPVGDGSNLPVIIVSRELNSLDFSTNPEEALASLLTKLGMYNGAYIIKYLVPLIKYGDIFSFLSIVAGLSPVPKDRIIIGGGSDIIGGGSSGPTPSVETAIEIIEKPALNVCPPVPGEISRVAEYIYSNQDSQTAIKDLEEYFLEPMPLFDEWVSDPSSLFTWLVERNYPYYPAVQELSNGNLYDFFVLSIFIATGIDIEAYENVSTRFKATLSMSFSLPVSGVQNDFT